MNASPAPILALHYMLGSGRMWLRLARLLPRPLICLDLPGHGARPAETGDITEAAVALALDAAPDGPFDVLGHSYGGYIALRLMADYSARIRRAVLVEPVFFAAAAAPKPTPEEMLGSTLDPVLAPVAALDAFTRRWGLGAQDSLKPDQQAYMAERLPLIPASQPSIAEDRADVLERLPSIPVTLVQGDQSPAVVGRIMKGLTSRIPAARQQIIKGAGHMSPITHPAELARIVSESLPDRPS